MRKHPRTEREPHVRPTARHRGEAGSVTAAKTRADSRTCSIRVPRPEELLQRERIAATEPREIAYFSKFADDRVAFDRSNLAAYTEPKVGVDLLEGMSSYVSKDEADPTAHPAPIKPVLDALLHFQPDRSSKQTAHFVTFRNNMNKIMGTPYNTSNEWTFVLEKRDGCVYMDVRRTQQEIESNRRPHENQRRGAYAGRRFEIYATQGPRPSDSSETLAHDDRTVNEDEEFCTLSSLTLGDKRLVVAAEIDCCDPATDHEPARYVELKTFRLLERDKDRYVFERFKLLAFWIQSYLVGTPKIVCGFRDDDFVVRKLQTFKTADIPSFGRKYWSPAVCLNFSSMLLDWLYSSAEEGQVYQVSYFPRRHVIEMALANGERSFLSAVAAATQRQAGSL